MSDPHAGSPLAAVQAAFRENALCMDDSGAMALLADPEAERKARLTVYRNNTIASLVEALALAFPACRLQVGDENFTWAASRFVMACPPEAAVLAQYGAAFPDFLETLAPVRQNAAALPDLARLEWALHAAYFAAEACTLAPSSLADLPADQLENLRFVAHPSACLVETAWAALDLWQAEEPVAPEPRQSFTLVARRGAFVEPVALCPATAAFTRALLAGQSLGEATGRAAASARRFDLQAALLLNLQAGSFSAVHAGMRNHEKNNDGGCRYD